MQWRIGCSGWVYRHWKGEFYPATLPQARWLEHYAAHFDTVELNASHYRLPTERAVRDWRQRVPPGFVYAVKASRLITHYRRLANCEAELATFIDRMRGLGDRIGPVLYQLPPQVRRDNARLAAFLRLLPRDLLHVFEFRHPSWWERPVFDLLAAHGAAFCVYNMGDTTTPVVATCADLYVRFHGPGGVYASSYDDTLLADWAGRLAAVPGVRRIWAYFNNDAHGYAPKNAARLRELASLPRAPLPVSGRGAPGRGA
jgi:uncharacterized protein YecE (DUF72 family)